MSVTKTDGHLTLLSAKGISKRTLDRAKPTIGIVAYRERVPGPWLWKLPSGEAEVLLVGTPVNQIGFWNELMWVRADGESIFFYDRTRKLAATTLLRRDAILTFTPDGWYAGPLHAERILRGFRHTGERLTDAEILARSSPEKVREALKGLGSPQP